MRQLTRSERANARKGSSTSSGMPTGTRTPYPGRPPLTCLTGPARPAVRAVSSRTRGAGSAATAGRSPLARRLTAGSRAHRPPRDGARSFQAGAESSRSVAGCGLRAWQGGPAPAGHGPPFRQEGRGRGVTWSTPAWVRSARGQRCLVRHRAVPVDRHRPDYGVPLRVARDDGATSGATAPPDPSWLAAGPLDDPAVMSRSMCSSRVRT